MNPETVRRITGETYSLQDAAREAGQTVSALYKSLNRDVLKIGRKRYSGTHSFTFSETVGIAVYGDLMRAGVPSPVAAAAADKVAANDFAALLLEAGPDALAWIVVSETNDGHNVGIANGADGLLTALKGADGRTATLSRLHTTVQEVAASLWEFSVK